MLKFCANLSFLFTDIPFLDRFTAAARAGFQGCEYLFPYEYSSDQIAQALSQSGLKQILFNLHPGDWSKGERGLAALPGRESEFKQSVETALKYALATQCRHVHIMAGASTPEVHPNDDVYLENLTYAAKRLNEHEIIGLIEPINPIDMPGYFLTDVDQALDCLRSLNAPNLKLQFDCYHRATVGKDILAGLDKAADWLGHIQIAGYPDRNEPNTGTLDYGPVFQKLLNLRYDGWIGCEYHPKHRTDDGLSWRDDFLNVATPLNPTGKA